MADATTRSVRVPLRLVRAPLVWQPGRQRHSLSRRQAGRQAGRHRRGEAPSILVGRRGQMQAWQADTDGQTRRPAHGTTG